MINFFRCLRYHLKQINFKKQIKFDLKTLLIINYKLLINLYAF